MKRKIVETEEAEIVHAKDYYKAEVGVDLVPTIICTKLSQFKEFEDEDQDTIVRYDTVFLCGHDSDCRECLLALRDEM